MFVQFPAITGLEPHCLGVYDPVRVRYSEPVEGIAIDRFRKQRFSETLRPRAHTV